jgi:hypothetical protein
MSNNYSRRNVFKGTVAAGLAAGSMPMLGQAPKRAKEAKLTDVWGADFLCQWSPLRRSSATSRPDLRPSA